MTIYKDLKIGSSVNGTSQRYTYNITSSVSSVSGADANGNTLAYDSGFADVYLNGVRLSGADITITSGNSVSFASNLSNGDVIDIVAYGAFTVASVNADNLSSGTVPDARITGAYTGITGLDLTDNSKIRLGTGNDLEIYHDGSHSHIRDSGTGDLRLRSTFLRLLNASSEPYILCSSGGSVELYHNNSKKFETTSGGVAVTGDLTVDTDTLFVDSSNNRVGIGTTAPAAVLDVRDETNGANFIVGGSGTTNITKIGGGGGDSLAIYSGTSTKVATFSTSGNTFLEGGIYLSGETGTANKLDDYEEGDWTPTVGGNASYHIQRGRYYKIGNIVVALYHIKINALGTGNNELISGLPFTSENDTNLNVRSGYVSYFSDLAVSVASIASYVVNNGTSFHFTSTTGSQSTATNAPNILGNNAEIYGTVIYNTA